MTDPIERARSMIYRAFVLDLPSTNSSEAIDAYEQAILRHHPDVVRLVLAARRLAVYTTEGQPFTACRLCYATWVEGAAERHNTDCALDPFKEVQE